MMNEHNAKKPKGIWKTEAFKMKKVSMVYENNGLKIFIGGIKSMKDIPIGIVDRNLVIWDKKLKTIKLPYKAQITKKWVENNRLKIILKRQ